MLRLELQNVQEMLLGGRRGAAGGGRKLGGATSECVLTTHPLPVASLFLSVCPICCT